MIAFLGRWQHPTHGSPGCAAAYPARAGDGASPNSYPRLNASQVQGSTRQPSLPSIQRRTMSQATRSSNQRRPRASRHIGARRTRLEMFGNVCSTPTGRRFRRALIRKVTTTVRPWLRRPPTDPVASRGLAPRLVASERHPNVPSVPRRRLPLDLARVNDRRRREPNFVSRLRSVVSWSPGRSRRGSSSRRSSGRPRLSLGASS